jgi:P-type Cu2+ transporter
MTTSTFEVGDLFSVLGARGIEKQLHRVPGVGSVSVNPVSGSTTVMYDPGRTGPAAIQTAIRECGFHCAGEAFPRHVCGQPPTAAKPHAGAPAGQNTPAPARMDMKAAGGMAGHKTDGGEKNAAMAQEMGHGAGVGM